MELLGGSKSKISKSLLKKWRGTSPYPIFGPQNDDLSFCGGGTFITFLKINIFQFHFLGRSRGVSCTLWITETRKKCIYSYKGNPTTKWLIVILWSWGFFNVLGGGEIFFSGFYGSDDTWHTPKPAYKAKLKNIHFSKSYKGTLITKWQMVISCRKLVISWWGRGLRRSIFRAKTLKFWI